MIRPLLISARTKAGLLEQPVVVLEADEPLRPPIAVPVEDAVPGGLAHRQGDENREQEQRGRQEDGDRRPAVERHAPSRLDESGRRARPTPTAAKAGSAASAEAKATSSIRPKAGYCWSAASWIAAAAASGVICPAATATETSLTTRPTEGPRSWSKKFW